MGVWKAIKGAAKKIGNVATKAAPFVGMIPGVGTLAATGIGAAGGLLSGKGVKGALKYGALGAAGNIGANLLGKIPGVGFLADKGKNVFGFGGGDAGAVGDVGGAFAGQGDASDIYGDIGGTMGGGGGGGGALNAVGKVAKGGGGMDLSRILGAAGKLAPLALGAAGAYQNAQQASQNRELTAEQIANAREAIRRQRELQERALQPINIQAPDLSSIFRSENPFAQRPPMAQGGM